jgi:hypothetical protein
MRANMLVRSLFVISAGFAPVRAAACEKDPFIFQLPGESEADAHERSDRVRKDLSVVESYERESYDFKNASRIYLARVVSRTSGSFDGNVKILPSTRVHAIAALKGDLPSTERILTDQGESGMCTDVGDGEGSWTEVNKLVVVFEGLPKSEYRPRGMDSFGASSIRTVPLLDLMRVHGKDLED